MPSNIYWTRQAREDLRDIRVHIARDAPVTAATFVRRLRQSVSRLREFPLSGQVVPETGREVIREVSVAPATSQLGVAELLGERRRHLRRRYGGAHCLNRVAMPVFSCGRQPADTMPPDGRAAKRRQQINFVEP